MSQELVSGRKLEVSVEELEAELLVWIQRLLDQGDHDQADRLVLVNATLAVRELSDAKAADRALLKDKAFLRFRRDQFVKNLGKS